MEFLSWLLWGRGHGLGELARRLDVDARDLRRFQPGYRRFTIPKRSGGTRRILARLCTHDGGLPQGAPTSPRLSNLVNYRFDARLAGMADALGGVYTRYADDITISFPKEEPEEEWVARTGEPPPFSLAKCPNKIGFMRAFVRRVAAEEGYRVHRRKKQSVRRRHHRQMVTGLVVNDGVNLPRKTRRWLRAVEHRAQKAKESPFDFANPSAKRPTLTSSQPQGWRALQAMIANQTTDGDDG